jgi:hypothetical protein
MYQLNLIQFIAFCFIVAWVGMDVIQAEYSQKLFWAIAISVGIGYLENAHGKFWNWIKNLKK